MTGNKLFEKTKTWNKSCSSILWMIREGLPDRVVAMDFARRLPDRPNWASAADRSTAEGSSDLKHSYRNWSESSPATACVAWQVSDGKLPYFLSNRPASLSVPVSDRHNNFLIDRSPMIPVYHLRILRSERDIL